ncbi:MAG: hypothetical protein JWN46_2013 [Acidimicrobiales bacterium]|nr:hypothetical protein [Acidimicrobiales bacterium]
MSKRSSTRQKSAPSARITSRSLTLALCIPIISIGAMTLLSRRPSTSLLRSNGVGADWGRGEPKGRADAVDVALSAAGSGWRTSSPSSADALRCPPEASRSAAELAGHASADLVRGHLPTGPGSLISVRTTVFVDAGHAQWSVATVSTPPGTSCLDRAVRAQFGAKVQGGILPGGRFLSRATQMVNTTGEYVVTSPTGAKHALHTGTVTVRTGAVATTIRFLALDDPVDLAAVQRVVNEAVSRQRG